MTTGSETSILARTGTSTVTTKGRPTRRDHRPRNVCDYHSDKGVTAKGRGKSKGKSTLGPRLVQLFRECVQGCEAKREEVNITVGISVLCTRVGALLQQSGKEAPRLQALAPQHAAAAAAAVAATPHHTIW